MYLKAPGCATVGRLEKREFDETLSRGRFRGQNPDRNRPVSLSSHKTADHTAIYGSQKEDISTQPGPGWNYDQVLGVCTGRRMAQPEADRRPLHLRAMPPGRLRGNDATLTMQAVTTIELAPADVCANCGAQLLEEQEVKDLAWTPLLGSGAPTQRKGDADQPVILYLI